MDMQDKEFDKIFNEKFEDFEVEPSAMVWDNIAGELDGKKAKPAIMPWLSIAATVLVVLTAGILFLQKGESTDNQPKTKKLVANHVETPTTITSASPVETVTTKPAENVESTTPHQHNVVASINNTSAPVNNTAEPVIKTTETVKNDNPQLIAAVIDPASTHVSTATVPDVTLAPQMLEVGQQVEKPVMAAQSTAPAKKRGIHNLGGLINVLVAKVDKREDKLIEFSDSDDDDNGSDLTGINLGLIKIKKQQ
ncbi:hypothetical protein [Mucilaginibacter sp. UYCu711]|uniref:hypothetical protein n=1 Tax=Mucilaginibacter sp. UYCu711 TaxID=3156339 RepID=UPI003D22FB04